MRSLFKKLFVISITIMFAHNVKAQDTTNVDKAFADYVITMKGDTLACRVTFPLFSTGKDNYKTVEMKRSQSILPEEIKEYYVSRKKILFRSVYKPGKKKPIFFRVIENGNINLYEQILTTSSPMAGTSTWSYSSTTNWYIAKGSDTVKELKTSGWFLPRSKKGRKDDFAEMIMDKKDVYDKYIADDKFSFKQLRQLVHLYNTGEWVNDFDISQSVVHFLQKINVINN